MLTTSQAHYVTTYLCCFHCTLHGFTPFSTIEPGPPCRTCSFLWYVRNSQRTILIKFQAQQLQDPSIPLFRSLLARDTSRFAFEELDDPETHVSTRVSCFFHRVCPRLGHCSLGTRAASRSKGSMTQKHVFRHTFHILPSSMPSFGPLLARDTSCFAFEEPDDPESYASVHDSPRTHLHQPKCKAALPLMCGGLVACLGCARAPWAPRCLVYPPLPSRFVLF